MTMQHPAARGGYRRGRFDNFSETASNVTASPFFYVVCLLLIAGFVVIHFAGAAAHWLIFVGDMMTAVNLLLLALLKNSERRAEHALQHKLDAIAAALLEQHEGRGREAHEDLKKAIRIERQL
ncbi:hypothetical protein ACWGJ2_22385 [Streptomyces sp. NPDC054796]